MSPRQPAIVIGAGLAGGAAAAALARRGRDVLLIATDTAATDVPAAVISPSIAPAADPLSRLRRLGGRVTRAWMHHLDARGIDCGRVADGVLILPQRARERARRDRLAGTGGHIRRLDPEAAHAVSGFRPAEDVVLHRAGGCLVPARFATGLRSEAGARMQRLDARVAGLERAGDTWLLRDGAGAVIATGAPVVLAAGADSARLWPAVRPWLLPARGQATAFAPTPETATLRLPLSGGGYVTPPIDGIQWVGATLQRGDADPQPRPADDRINLHFVRDRFGLERAPQRLASFVGIRATTPDRLPLVGQLEDGLWISAGHGSHGLLTAPVAAHIIAERILGRRAPRVARLLGPQRRG